MLENMVMVILLLPLIVLPEKLPRVKVLPEVKFVYPLNVVMLSRVGIPMLEGTTTLMVSAVAINTVLMKLTCNVVDFETVVLLAVIVTFCRTVRTIPEKVVVHESIISPVAIRVDIVMLSVGFTVGGRVNEDIEKLKALAKLLLLILLAVITV